MEYSPLLLALLVVTGFVAGIINTLAGGGSSLTIPALMILGLPADVANATNRVGVTLQCLVGTAGFKKAGKLETADIGPVLLPTLAGGLLGAVLAAFMPLTVLKPVLLSSMVLMALIILIRPAVIAPPEGTPHRKVGESPQGFVALFIAGIYGGFVQAGVGFILIAALAGSLRYDLVRSNALKMVCTLAFTLVALAVFIVQDLILWLPGLILALGTMAGAAVAVKMAIKVSQNTLKWFLFLMTLCTCGAAMVMSS
jgi:uncharacterized membrane protein YfcA